MIETVPAGTTLWKDAWRRLRRNRMAVAGLLILELFVLGALMADGVASAVGGSYESIVYAYRYHPPLWEPFFPMGTDQHGRDLFVRVLYGARMSLAVGFVATLVSVLIGVSYGAVSGYCGGWVDGTMMRFVDILYSLPYMFFVILLTVFFGRSLLLIFVAIGAVEWLTIARIVRGQVLSLREKEFVEAARALGGRGARLIFRHLIPNLLGVVIVYSTLSVPRVMLAEAFLSFLGLGVQEPYPSWGALAQAGSSLAVLQHYPWLLVFPCLALALTLFALNFLGDGLRDALDPQTLRG
jgi:oligopeptide transport system permease protein